MRSRSRWPLGKNRTRCCIDYAALLKTLCLVSPVLIANHRRVHPLTNLPLRLGHLLEFNSSQRLILPILTSEHTWCAGVYASRPSSKEQSAGANRNVSRVMDIMPSQETV